MSVIESEIPIVDRGLQAEASDWHFKPEKKIRLRIHGKLIAQAEIITTAELDDLIAKLAPKGVAQEDGSFTYKEQRFRFAIATAQGKPFLTIRHLPKDIRAYERLGVPAAFTKLTEQPRGIIVVTGPTGSGKSSTLASTIDRINKTSRDGSIIETMENPTEYEYIEDKCLFYQRELYRDFKSFPKAIEQALRHDPDIIIIGEMRSQETFKAAISAAETGHLVFTTAHTGNASSFITRYLDAVPTNYREEQRAALAKSLICILAVQLVPSLDGKRVLACELCVNNQQIRNCIRNGTYDHIDEAISTTRNADGGVLMDDFLEKLVLEKRISKASAIEHAIKPKTLETRLKNVP